MSEPKTPRRAAPSIDIKPARRPAGLDAVVTLRWSDVTTEAFGQVVRDEVVIRVRVLPWAYEQAEASAGPEPWADQVEDRAMRLAALAAIRAAEDLISAPWQPRTPAP